MQFNSGHPREDCGLARRHTGLSTPVGTPRRGCWTKSLCSLPSSPTSDGAAAAVLASEEFVHKYGLQAKAVEIVAQEMMTDLPSTFEEKSVIKMVHLIHFLKNQIKEILF